jgi:uncharacterized membrane protein
MSLNERARITLVAVMASAAAISCGADSATTNAPIVIGPPARIVVSPADTTIDVGVDVPLRISVFDAANHTITTAQITAISDKPDVASIALASTVRANFLGKASVTVSAGGVSATARVSVLPHFVVLPFPLGATTATPSGMNDAGMIVGNVTDDAVIAKAFRYTPAGGSEYLGSTFEISVANGVNAAGTVVGWGRLAGTYHLSTWSSSGTLQDYGTLGIPGGAQGMAINNSGQLAAYYGYLLPGYGVIDHTGRFDVATRTITDVFDVNPAGNGQPVGMSDDGAVLGFGRLPGSNTSAFLWSPEKGPRTIPLSDGRLVTATSISANGTMTGYAGVVGGGVQAVLIVPGGQVKTIPPPGDGQYMVPSSVNDRGEVVGISATNGEAIHPMFWREDVGFFDLSVVSAQTTHVRGISPNGSMAFGWMDEAGVGQINHHPVMWVIRRI